MLPDCIHKLLSASPRLSPAKLVRHIQGRSSRRLQEEFPEMSNRCWGQHLGARGHFCATLGAVDEATIKAYFDNQKWDENDQDSRSPLPPNLGPAVSRGFFGRLQPQPDF